MVNRRNRRRARRSTRRNNNSNANGRNRRNMVLYRRPPNPGAVPRSTGLSAGGLTTTVLFEIPVAISRQKPSTKNNGWDSLPSVISVFNINPNSVFKSRTDSIQGLLALYSEYRFNRITAHWIPHVGWASHGQFAMAVVDASYGTPTSNSSTYVYDDVAVAPNSTQVHVGQRTGRAWVPTEPTALDWRGPSDTAAHILYATSEVFAPVGDAEKVTIGRILVRVHLSLRSPITTTNLAVGLFSAMQE